jgi:hypothetical protein
VAWAKLDGRPRSGYDTVSGVAGVLTVVVAATSSATLEWCAAPGGDSLVELPGVFAHVVRTWHLR